MPSGLGHGLDSFRHHLTSGPATQLQVSAPENVQSGAAFDVEVEARDANDRLATGYLGTVHFTLATPDAGATLPVDYTFTAADHGEHVFQITLSALGSQTIAATDTTTSSITGSATTTVEAAPVATQLGVFTDDNATAGVPTKVTVVALDASDERVRTYTGTVTLTSTDPKASLPASYTFTAADHGRHTFEVTFQSAGPQTVTAADTSGLTGVATTTVEAAPVATQLGVFTDDNTTAGVPTNVTVVALDASGERVPGYTGTVTLTSTDPKAILPASFTFTAADHGRHTFQVTFQTTGAQTVTATDAGGLTGSAATMVNAAPAADHLVVRLQKDATAGVSTAVTVVVVDASGRRVPNYTGTVKFTSSDAAAVLPADYTFTAADRGRHTFPVTFKSVGAQTVTATDSATASITGKGTVTVSAMGVVTHFGVFTEDHAAVGSPVRVKIVALDAANHVVPGYTGTIHISSSDKSAVLPADYTFQAGDNGKHYFVVTFNTVGAQTLSATDTVNSALTGLANVQVITPGHGHHGEDNDD